MDTTSPSLKDKQLARLAGGNSEAFRIVQELEKRYEGTAAALKEQGIKGQDILLMHEDVFDGDIDRSIVFISKFLSRKSREYHGGKLKMYRYLSTDAQTGVFDVRAFVIIVQLCTVDYEVEGAIHRSERPPRYVYELYKSKKEQRPGDEGHPLSDTRADLLEWYLPFKRDIDKWRPSIMAMNEYARALELGGEIPKANEQREKISILYNEWEKKLDVEAGKDARHLYKLLQRGGLAIQEKEALSGYKMLDPNKLVEFSGGLKEAAEHVAIAGEWKRKASEVMGQGQVLAACNAHIQACNELNNAHDYIGAVAELENAKAALAPLLETETDEVKRLEMLTISNELDEKLVLSKGEVVMRLKRTFAAIDANPYLLMLRVNDLFETVKLMLLWDRNNNTVLDSK